jgi:hypothetical protein
MVGDIHYNMKDMTVLQPEQKGIHTKLFIYVLFHFG